MLEEWRRWQFGSDGSLSLFGDLGVGVLDGALVEAVAYTFCSTSEREPALFFKTTEQGLEIDEMITHLRQGTLPRPFPNVHLPIGPLKNRYKRMRGSKRLRIMGLL
jgi:hypothetical protein